MSPGNRKIKNIDSADRTTIKSIGFCSFGTGGNASAVDVSNGKILRIRPLHFDWQYKPEDFKPWKLDVRGKTFTPPLKNLLPPFSLVYKKRVYSPNRILYPLKRIDWNPEGERHPENRGKSGYVRISWDEALEIIAGEIKRQYKKYGPYSILAQADGHGETKTVHGPHGCSVPLLELLGGYTLQTRNPDSWEGFYWGGKFAWGMEPIGLMMPQTNVFVDMAENSQMVLYWGCDPETTTWGFGGQMVSRLCYWFSELDIKQVYVCPDLNYGAAVHADKWIPVLPNSDAALQLSIAYTWMVEGTYDKDYVKTHTYGYENFEEYVMGREDGIPKTPKWAEEKCGVPSRIIKALARDWAKKRTSIAHGNGGSYIRGPYSTEPGRLEVCLLAMQGLGKPGVQQVSTIDFSSLARPLGYDAYPPLPGSARPPDFGCKIVPHLLDSYQGWDPFIRATPTQFVPETLVHEAILNPPISWYGTTLLNEKVENQWQKYSYPVKGFPEIHMIWSDKPCMVTCWNDGNALAQAYCSPKIEFILTQHPWMENDCVFADIILPSNTKFEEKDIGDDIYSLQFNTCLNEERCIEPVGESKSDYEIVCLIAGKLGLLEKYTRGKSVEEWIKHAFDTSGVPEFISYAEFKKKGYFVVPTNPDWHKLKPGLREFYEDPGKDPMKTPSGKIEFYSRNLAEHFPRDRERPPVPHWIEKGTSHDERLSSQRAEKYPLLAMSNHGRWRVHANFDDVSWFHETPTGKVRGADGYLYEPVWINPSDAKKRGIANNDVVRVYNERGVVLGGAYIAERIIPGAISMDHGARADFIVPGELDRGGAINTICPHMTISKNAAGMVCSGFLVEVEKADPDELRQKYPEAFSRPYDNGSGLKFESYCNPSV